MLYFRLNEKFEVAGISAAPDLNAPGFQWAARGYGSYGAGWLCRTDIKDFLMALGIANDATKLMGKLYLAVDNGDRVWPRYDVIEAPAIGDEVSRHFNGDSYPAGKIIKISTNTPWGRKIETDDGTVFYRQAISARWVERGAWGMLPGHINERNPSF